MIMIIIFLIIIALRLCVWFFVCRAIARQHIYVIALKCIIYIYLTYYNSIELFINARCGAHYYMTAAYVPHTECAPQQL